MLDTAFDFESLAAYLDWRVLVIPGVVLVVLGLFLWLAGSAKYRFFAALFFALTGFIISYYFKFSVIATAVLTILGFAAGFLISKKAIAVAAGVTIFLVSIFLIYSLGVQDEPVGNNFEVTLEEKVSFSESLEKLREFADFALMESMLFLKSLYDKNLLIAVGAGVFAIIFGLFFPKIITALLFSFWGIVLIGIGMMLLLFFKGSDAVTRISENTNFYLTIAGGMLLLGFLMQLFLCPAKIKKQRQAENETQDENGDQE